MSGKNTIRVVAALVQRDGRVLITRRKHGSDFGGYWEFPGGKVESGETDKQALVRELLEEMDFIVEPLEIVYSKVLEYERFILDFHLYNCRSEDQEIFLHGIQDYAWIETGDLAKYDFPPADTEVVALISAGQLSGNGIFPGGQA